MVVKMRDGSVAEMPFATRLQAEMYLFQSPYLMMVPPHGDEVASANVSPLRVEFEAGGQATDWVNNPEV